MHLVGDDARAVPVDDRGQRAELVGGEHPPGRVVRVAQQHRARAGRERGVDRVEVERVALAVDDQRRGDDRPAGQLHDLEERRVRRRRDTTTGSPAATKTSSAAEIPLSTSATGKIRAGDTSHP